MDQSNLILLTDKNEWTPFSAVAAADIGFARHTSLADEMLAMGKPVIFDDFDGFPSDVYDYGDSVTAYSYIEIRNKLNDYLSAPVLYNEKINPMRKRLYHMPMVGGEAIKLDIIKWLADIDNNAHA